MRTQALERLAAWDRGLCIRFNRASDYTFVLVLFAVTSRLGNGLFWYALMVALLWLEGALAGPAVTHMFAVGTVSTALYKWLKSGTSRPRPYRAQPGITLCAMPLDKFSFPSGHTLHAVALTSVVMLYFPLLGWMLVPFTILVALSRVVLGLHYPSDVLAGALIGGSVAIVSGFIFS